MVNTPLPGGNLPPGNNPPPQFHIPLDPFHPTCKVHNFAKVMGTAIKWRVMGQREKSDGLIAALSKALNLPIVIQELTVNGKPMDLNADAGGLA